MAQLFDIRGNEYQGSLDRIGGAVETDVRPLTVALAALNAEVLIDVNGANTLTVNVNGTFSASLVVEASLDGVNYLTTSLPLYNPSTGQYAPNVITVTGAFLQVPCSGFKRLRVRCSVYASGSAVVAIRGSSGALRVLADQLPATSAQAQTAAANTAVTLTLAPPGLGLFHYIDQIVIQRHVAVAVAAGTAVPLSVTSTNFTGAPSWDTPQAIQALGENNTISFNYARGIRSAVANTATTIVAPANISYIWKVMAIFRVGP